jgi:hypothetical protein
MKAIQLSQKANELIDWVQIETRKPISIIISEDVGANMLASFRPDPNSILINVTERLLNNGQDAVDQSVCHEAVHGLLLHGHGYSFPVFVNAHDQEIRMSINLCMTMIDDIVVNKILEEKGMLPFTSQYIAMVRREIDAINTNADIYKEHLAIGTHFYQRFKIFRYIMAHGFLTYYQLIAEHAKLISRFTKHFERYFTELMPETKQIVTWINVNNIFTPQGHRIVVENILGMWGLFSYVQLKTYNPQSDYL